MTRTFMQYIGPTTDFGPDRHNLVIRAVRAARRRLTPARKPIDRESRDFAIRQDLGHLDRNQLRDIGLDRDAL